jgi:hypothetical protein
VGRVSLYDQNVRSTRIQHLSFDVQRQLSAGFVLAGGYADSATSHMVQGTPSINVNQLPDHSLANCQCRNKRAAREENLKEEQRFRLRDLLRYNLKTVRAYLLKEAFQQLWEYSSPSWAGKFLDEWCRQTMRSRIEPIKKIARSLRQHRELVLNYFRAQKLISSGVVEGLNNKAKVTMRKSYGFRTYRVLELALYHSLGKLPEPESTHDFF